MKKLICMAVLFAILTTATYVYVFFATRENETPVEWYDEELNLGYAEDCGYYTILDRAENYTAQERAERNMYDHYVMRLVNLSDETVEAIRNGEWCA